MYQQNPLLTESKKQLMKQLSRYTPEQVSKIRSKMLSLGKENGGWYSADEYGRRMYQGQVKRASKLFSKYGFKPNMYTDDRPYKAGVSFARTFEDGLNDVQYVIPGVNDKLTSGMSSIKTVAQNPETKDRILAFLKDNGAKSKSMTKKISRYNKNLETANIPLTNAHTATHETDELESLLKNYNRAKGSRKRLRSFWNGVDSHLNAIKNPMIQTHNPGVLSREAKRDHLLRSMYGKQVATRPRSHKEFTYNSGDYFR